MAPKKAIKKTQLRRCSICDKTGHNKSRCPEALAQPTQKTAGQPLRFFVHHVNFSDHKSKHVINLKNEENSWENVNASSPSQSDNPDYFFYHEKSAKKSSKIAPEKNVQKIDIDFSSQFTQKSKAPKKPFGPKLKSAFRPFIEAPKKVLATALLVVFLLSVPMSARTYYSDVKSTANKIASNSTVGFGALQDSTSAMMKGDIVTAQEQLSVALGSFNQAIDTLNSKHKFLQTIASGLPILSNEVKSRQRLVTAGHEIALGNAYLLKGLEAITAANSSTITEGIKTVANSINFSVPHYKKAVADLSKVDPNVLPFEYQSAFKDFRLLFTAYLNDLQSLGKLGMAFEEIFGGKGLRRYLLAFQNPYEIRPTGGFLGSFALIDVKDGKLVKLDIPAGGSYDLQGQLNQFVIPPTPLLLSNKRWEFQDSNWFADFPASADKMLWFYRHSRNATADGVIAINASVLNKILAITGPVTDSERNITITSENALTTIQEIVEFGPEKKQNKPKQVLSDLAQIFVEYFKNIKPADAMTLLTNLNEALGEKDIQAYFTDARTQNTMKEFGWSGEILRTKDQDYLYVVNTNIQGQKSDAKIKQLISHQAVVQENGDVINSVVVTREHNGVPGEKLYGQTNVDYIRLYVPEGSELISANGFTWPDETKFRVPEKFYKQDENLNSIEKEIKIDSESGTRVTKEFGKTAFGNWIITEPGSTSQVQFIYKLPFKAVAQKLNEKPLNNWVKIFQTKSPLAKYQLVVQKQSGVNSEFESQIIYPNGWKPIWSEGNENIMASNGMSINKMELNQNQIWSMVLSK